MYFCLFSSVFFHCTAICFKRFPLAPTAFPSPLAIRNSRRAKIRSAAHAKSSPSATASRLKSEYTARGAAPTHKIRAPPRTRAKQRTTEQNATRPTVVENSDRKIRAQTTYTRRRAAANDPNTAPTAITGTTVSPNR